MELIRRTASEIYYLIFFFKFFMELDTGLVCPGTFPTSVTL